MQPSGDQLQRLQAILLDAFAYADLRGLVRIRLDAELEQIVPIIDRNLTQIVASLIRVYAAQSGGLHRLTQAAQTERPARPDLPPLVAHFAAAHFAVLPLPDSTAALPGQTLHTDGGAVIQGNIAAGRDWVGRDQYNITQVLAAPRPALYIGVPSLPQHFVGRETLLVELVDRLVAGQSTALSADGLPGVGKTTLAVALARHPRVLAHFGDGLLWAGLGPTADVASIQATWADALGAEIGDLLDPYARQQRLNNALGQRRLLLVLDDAWAWEPLRQLRSSGPQVSHLLTTRDQELARRFAGAGQSISVPVLAPEPGYELLQRLAPEACASDPAAAQHLAAAVDGLPLALELLGSYLGASSQRRTQARRQQALTSLHDPATRLALATQRLGDPARQHVTLHTTIALSLADLPPTTVAAFYALGAFAAKPARFALPAALAVTAAAEEALFTLADRNLVELAEDETLALHQTLADLARTQTPVEAVTRHRDHYLALVDEDREDWQRIEAVYPQLQYVWHARTDDEDILDFIWALRTFQRRRGLWSDHLGWIQQGLQLLQAREQHKDAATLLNELGFGYSATGEKAQALAYYNQALPLMRQVGDKGGEAATLNNLGEVYDDLGEKALALAYFNQALPFVRQVGDKGGEATTLNNLGLVYSALGDKAQALDYYNQALPLRRQVGDKGGEATTLNNLGEVYRSLGDMAQALDYFNQALPLLRQVGDKGGEATTLNNLGLVYSALGDKAQALDYYNQALPLRRQVGDKGGEATTLNNIGEVYRSLGDMAQALDYFNQALPLLRQVGDKGGEATTLNNLGAVYCSLGDMAQALDYFNQALPLLRQVGDKGGEATTLNNLGEVYRSLGDMEQALAYFNQALPLHRQVGDKGGEATTLSNLGRVYDDLGEKEQALAYYNQALPLYRQVGDKGGEATTLNNLGAVYDALGEKEQALAYFNQALPLYRQVGDKGGEATTLNNIGGVYNALGDKAQALAYFHQALPLRRQVGDKGGEASTLNNLGLVYSALGDKAQALEYYNQALPLFRQVGDRWGESVTRFNLAMVYEALGDLAAAEEQLRMVVALDEATGHPDLASDQAVLKRLQAKRAAGQGG